MNIIGINKLKNLLFQPYPFYYHSVKRIFIMAGILTVTVALFIYLIRPFTYDYAEHRFPFWVISAFNGLLVGILFLFYTGMIRGFTPQLFLERHWTLGKELGFWFLFIFITGIGNFFLRELIYTSPENLSFYFLRLEIMHSMIVGTFFLLLIIMGKYIHIVTTTQDKANTWSKHVRDFRQKQFHNPSVTVISESPQEQISFHLAELLYIIVDGNYVELHLLNKDGTTRRHILRNTLGNVEKQLKTHSHILRVHRSYMVNITKITSVAGNAQGYKLQIENCESPVPVSRTYLPSFDDAMNR